MKKSKRDIFASLNENYTTDPYAIPEFDLDSYDKKYSAPERKEMERRAFPAKRPYSEG